MAYIQHFDNYRYLLQTGRVPVPYPYNIQYINTASNLHNETNCLQNFYSTIPLDSYYRYGPDYQPNSFPIYDVAPYVDPSVSMAFHMVNLVSNVIDFALNQDVNLLRPWGIIVINDKIWVTNVGTGLITCYNLRGVPLLPVINVFGIMGGIAQITGITYNYTPNDFYLYNGPLEGSAAIIVCTQEGTINGYNSAINSNIGQLLYDGSRHGSVYTGIAIVNTVNNLIIRQNQVIVQTSYRNLLYVVDFFNNRIDTFDGLMNKLDGFPFNDEDTNDPIVDDYAPYNIANIGDNLFVSYARQRPTDKQYELLGSGFGYVSIFTIDGLFVKRFASGGCLNAPWGMIDAPAAFGYPAGSIMITNYGDGTVNIFDLNGNCLGPLKDFSYNTMYFGGLRGIAYNPICSKQVYWVASNNALRDAFVGTIGAKF